MIKQWISAGMIPVVGLVAACAGFSTLEAADAQEPEVSVTVYNQNFALVKDVRALNLSNGMQEIRIDDVAASIDPTSVHFASVDHAGRVSVLEQNFQYDLAGAERLLERYLNREITLVLKDGTTRTGSLLSVDGGSVVLTGSTGVSIVNRAEVRDISLGELPGGLVAKPTLVWSVSSEFSGADRAEVSYLTDNVSWHAEYVAVASADDTALDLSGWVSLENHSGATYRNAKLKLVAGDVNRVGPEMMPRRMKAEYAMAVADEAQFEERGFFEYHIYQLARPATIADRETKQLSLFPSAHAGAKKLMTYDGANGGDDVSVRMEFKNSANNGLGMALPAGKVRVYKEDSDGSLEFVGEDRLDHTPRDETVRLLLGNAFDVKGERTRTDFQQISNRSTQESFTVQIRNHKDEAVEVVVVEHLRGDWAILSETQDHVKKDSHTMEYRLQVPARENASVTYTVRTTW